jgi:hypothetical protein
MNRRFLSFLVAAALAVPGVILLVVNVHGSSARTAEKPNSVEIPRIHMSGARHQKTPAILLPEDNARAEVAITLHVCPTPGMSGDLAPGSTVAIYQTKAQNRPTHSSCSSWQAPGRQNARTVVAADAEVLSIEGARSQPSSGRLVSAPKTGACSGCQGEMVVTVAIPPAESMRLVNAAARGELTLVLLTDRTPPWQPVT